MRPLTSFLNRAVVTESGRKLGRCYDLRADLGPTSLKVKALVVGRTGLIEHFGIGPGKHATASKDKVRGHDTVPWEAVVRLEQGRIVVRDGTELE
jgi:sporulation protein YlmC with PRC-barrel domain